MVGWLNPWPLDYRSNNYKGEKKKAMTTAMIYSIRLIMHRQFSLQFSSKRGLVFTQNNGRHIDNVA